MVGWKTAGTEWDTPVLIAGGGPVGMTLALELAQHGVRSFVVERNLSTTRHPKMDITNGRSMELFRRLGLIDKMRAVGVPQSNPFDVVWATSASGHLLHKFELPSSNDFREHARTLNDGAQTLEPSMRISQVILEPVLRDAIEQNDLIVMRNGWAFDSLTQDSGGVTARIINSVDQKVETIRCAYLAGCDGGGSTVRKQVGIQLEGNASAGRVYMVHFKSPDRNVLQPWGTAWHLQTAKGNMIAQDDQDIYTLHVGVPEGTDESKIDPGKVLRDFIGQDFSFEVLLANPWTLRELLATRYSEGRVFIAGDAAHQVIPVGGYGMNTGIGDAVDLGWKLAAVVNGWGGPALLESFEKERRPIAVRNRSASQRHWAIRVEILELYLAAMADGDLDGESPSDDRRRSQLGQKIAALKNDENASWGIEHGYRYDHSPVNWREPGSPPVLDPLTCTPSTWPGSRLPHFFLTDGFSVYDKLGKEFTLLAIDSADTSAFERAAKSLSMPLTVSRLPLERVLDLLEAPLVLVRPDGHVAWRGASAAQADAVLRHAAGREMS
jgi:2-polyprenyl-6-methoxyphenol hydroxylase-like FAD-dependent oxidoreductase